MISCPRQAGLQEVEEGDEGIEEEEVEEGDNEQRTVENGSPKGDNGRSRGVGNDDDDDEGRVSRGDDVKADIDAEDRFECDEVDDYGYERPAEEDSDDSEAEPDDADDALGPEDGEGEGDETYLLGFAAL